MTDATPAPSRAGAIGRSLLERRVTASIRSHTATAAPHRARSTGAGRDHTAVAAHDDQTTSIERSVGTPAAAHQGCARPHGEVELVRAAEHLERTRGGIHRAS